VRSHTNPFLHWLSLTLICAFALASADALTKRALPDRDVRELTLVRFTVPGVLLLPWLLAHPLPAFPVAFWLWMAALLPAEIVAMLLYQRAIRDHPLALTVPYLAFTPGLVAVIGWVVLGETVSATGLAGILLIVFGGWLLNIRRTVGDGFWRQVAAPLAVVWQNPGSRQMLGVAVIYAFTAVGGKHAMAYGTPETFGALYFALLGLLTLLVFGMTNPTRLNVIPERPLAVLGVGALMAVMVVTHFMAISMVEAAYMIAVKRTSLLFGILYGALLFREANLGRNLVAGTLMVAGVALVAVG